jgi:hypothetical protein
MDHLTDSQLQAHLQGEPGADEAQALAAHVRDCADCRQRLAALESVWGQLGTWTTPAPAPDLEARILAGLPARTAEPKGRGWVRSMRVAAALVLAAGIGHAAGRLAWRPAADNSPDAEAAAAALHLDDPSTATMLLAALDAPEGGKP